MAESFSKNRLSERPIQRNRRARTGCERCRAQHRKCDAEKPQCRRCTDAGVTCKYAAHIVFLDRNSQTISTDVSSSLPSASANLEYPALEFVINKAPTQSRASVVPSNSLAVDYTEQPDLQRADFDVVQESRPVGGTDNSQFQVLGTNTYLFQRNNSQDSQADELEVANGPSSRKTPFETPRDLALWEAPHSWPLVGHSSLSDDEISLLKYYGHHIAPWLDVYDPGQTFRHLVTQLAMNSPCVLEGVLKLSATFSGRSTKVVERRGGGLLHLQAMSNPPGPTSPYAALRVILGFGLARMLLFVQAIPDTWEPSFCRGGVFPAFDEYTFADATERRIWLGFLVLMLRMEIASSLMDQTAPIMASKLLRQIQSSSETNNARGDQQHEILSASINCLGLLSDVMSLCFPEPEAEDDTIRPVASSVVPTSRAIRWKGLLYQLLTWEANRPSELRQLVDAESPRAGFPTLIFATGAGISANTLYHTAMLLLLSNRPQSVSLTELHKPSGQETASMSPHWHARRVCGIALNSDPEHTNCWDLSMIAAFSLVARRMTHLDQQNCIMACLNRVKLAGWHVDGIVQRLADEWGPNS